MSDIGMWTVWPNTIQNVQITYILSCVTIIQDCTDYNRTLFKYNNAI